MPRSTPTEPGEMIRLNDAASTAASVYGTPDSVLGEEVGATGEDVIEAETPAEGRDALELGSAATLEANDIATPAMMLFLA